VKKTTFDKFDKVITYSVPYIFGLTGIAWLYNPEYPLWGSILLIVCMGLATILHFTTLVKRIKRQRMTRRVYKGE